MSGRRDNNDSSSSGAAAAASARRLAAARRSQRRGGGGGNVAAVSSARTPAGAGAGAASNVGIGIVRNNPPPPAAAAAAAASQQQSAAASGPRRSFAASTAASRSASTSATSSAAAAAANVASRSRPLPSGSAATAEASSPAGASSPYRHEDSLSQMNERAAQRAASALASARKQSRPGKAAAAGEAAEPDNRPPAPAAAAESSLLERRLRAAAAAAAASVSTSSATAAAAKPATERPGEVRGGGSGRAISAAATTEAAQSTIADSSASYASVPVEKPIHYAVSGLSSTATTSLQDRQRQQARKAAYSMISKRDTAGSSSSSSAAAPAPAALTTTEQPDIQQSTLRSGGGGSSAAFPRMLNTSSADTSTAKMITARQSQQPLKSTTATSGTGGVPSRRTFSSTTSAEPGGVTGTGDVRQWQETAVAPNGEGATSLRPVSSNTARSVVSGGRSTASAKQPKPNNPEGDGNDSDKDDDPCEEGDVTIEEMEESIAASSLARPLDSSCLLYHTSNFLVRNRGENHRRLNCRDILEDEGAIGNCEGGEVTRASFEEWQLMPADNTTPLSRPLCYGDDVLLLPMGQSNKKRVLGIRVVQEQASKPMIMVCALPYTPASDAPSWTVLRALPNNPKGLVRIGRSAVERSQQEKQRGKRKTSATIFSGDPVLLRHSKTGFLLSMCDSENGRQFRVGLVTDSYNSRIPPGGANTKFLDRLQKHDIYLPCDRDIFHFTLSTVPSSTPFWISSAGSRRSFLESSYLPGAHRETSLAEEALFGRPSSTLIMPQVSKATETGLVKQLQVPSGQQVALFDELIASFLGLEGLFIRASPDEVGMAEFRLHNTEDVTFDHSISSLVNEMLPLSTSYARVRHFVSSHLPGYEYGSVMQALCEQLDLYLHEYGTGFIKDYLDEQYRKQPIGAPHPSLTQLLVRVRPTMHRMVVLRQAVDAARCVKGGALLNSLRKLKLGLGGDVVAAEILERLLDVAAFPFMKMLSSWMQRGVLDDPCREFMIQKNDSDNRWENSYSLIPPHVLEGCCSSKQTVTQILATGRYWNAIRACQDLMRRSNNATAAVDTEDDFPVLLYRTNVASMAASVQTVHRKASQLLSRLLLHNFALFDSLQLMKRYFLLEQGDFFVNFMDVAENELLKDISAVSQGRVQHWLNTAVQLAEHHDDLIVPSSQRDGVGCAATGSLAPLSPLHLQSRFESESLMDYLDSLHAESGGIDTHEAPTPLRHAYGEMLPESLTGLGAFVIDLSPVPFPTSLVLEPAAMSNYQLLFRHLFFAKYVERRLVDVWQDHQAFRELQSLRGSLGPTFILRQRMLHFLQNLIYYMFNEVIEPNWLGFLRKVEPTPSPRPHSEQTLDDIIQAHTGFLSKTLEACLLTNSDLLRSLTKLMSTCLLFTDQMKQFMASTKIDDDRRRLAIKKRRVVQRNLHDRGGVSRRTSFTRKLMEENLRNDMAERKERVKQQTARVSREVSSESYQRMISRFDQVFSEHLCDFMIRLKHSDAIVSDKVNLCIRLDYNGYLSNALGLASMSSSSKQRHTNVVNVASAMSAMSSAAGGVDTTSSRSLR